MTRPELESLEARWVPATIKLVSGNLFISNQTGPLTVTATATPGKFTVDDNGKVVTVSGVGSLISIRGNDLDNKITFKLAGNKFGGNLLINSGNGDDTVSISGGAAIGTLGGHLTVLTGNGIDIANVGQMKIGGNSTFNLGLGGDNDTFSGDQAGLNGLGLPVTYGGNVTVFNADNVFADVSSPTVACKIGGNLTVGGNDGFVNSWRMGFFLAGNASFTSGNTNDLVRLNSNGSIAGNLAVNLGGGNDAYQQGSGIAVGGKFDVFGNLSVNLGAGDDDFQIGNVGATLGGNATLNGGEGDNTYNLTAGMLVFGNLSVFGGNGENNLAASAIQATVAGDLSFQFGNGNNLITLGATSSVGGKLNVLTGNGDNTLTLLGAQTYNANVVFGSGDDTVELNNAALILTGLLDGGAGSNTLTQTMGTLSPNLVLVGF